mmetsp:Transcript_5029/g.8757  ORF Transcript_5029/g.8757 Transcript_5029/m.8757 type:complete len:241 (+) Transcript_5029:2119-2841(+)
MVMSTTFTVSIVSDILCPWCYVGLRHLETAVKHVKENAHFTLLKNDSEFQIKWEPFQLAPNLKHEQIPIFEYLNRKYGTRYQSADDMTRQSPLTGAGERTGIVFNNDRYVCDSFKGHVLVSEMERQKGWKAANQLMQRMFHGYFELAQDISDVDVLAKLAEPEMTEMDAKSILMQMDENVVDRVHEKITNARTKKRISGVPNFTISVDGCSDKIQFSGAQPPEMFIEAFKALHDQILQSH